jgi:hypothetical protein
MCRLYLAAATPDFLECEVSPGSCYLRFLRVRAVLWQLLPPTFLIAEAVPGPAIPELVGLLILSL